MWLPTLLPVAAAFAFQADGAGRAVPLGLDERVPTPAHNPITPAKIALGRELFFEPLLSRDSTASCATCHVPELAFTDGKPVSTGVAGRRGRRNAPTILNRAYGTAFAWDGRASSIEEQVQRAIRGENEMDMSLSDLAERVRAIPRYRARLADAFGTRSTAEGVVQAIATFVRTLFSANSPFDQFEHGKRDALSREARAGFDVFRDKGNCIRCHVGATFTDEGFHNTGVAWRDGAFADSGRYLVTGDLRDLGVFKTPTLREVSRTAPYMHDGSLATLEAVIEFYDQGGRPNPNVDPMLRPLGLTTEEKRGLLAFLRSLSAREQDLPR